MIHTIRDIKIYPKSKDIKLCTGLTLGEFECKCTTANCFYSLVDPKFIEQYEKLRIDYAAPIIINSGYRCQEHNRDVGGKQYSLHCIGRAIDITPLDFRDHPYKVGILGDLAENHFRRVIYYANFIHCQL